MKTFAGRKLGRPSDHRRTLLRELATNLLKHEKIQTTLPRAKEVGRFTEKIITMAKAENLAARRRVAGEVHQKEVQKKLFEVLVPRYQSRSGGYTQILRTGPRSGDAAPMAVIRLLP